VIGGPFLALSAYIGADGGRALVRREAPSESVIDIILASLSVAVTGYGTRSMPKFARTAWRIAQRAARPQR